jgi:hypothetical protein
VRDVRDIVDGTCWVACGQNLGTLGQVEGGTSAKALGKGEVSVWGARKV